MAAEKDIVVNVGADTSALRKGMRRGADSVTGFSRKSRQELADTAKRMAALGAAAVAAGAAIGGALIKAGMDVVESENLFRESFKDMSDQARKWSEKTSKALGLNQFELRRTSALIFNMTQSMGLAKDESFRMATGMTELAHDMASFFNLKPEEAFQKLKSGITGEAEPLKSLGILVDEATIKQAAYNHQLVKSGSQLTQTQKVQARWLAILDQTKTAQGDLARTADSASNRMRSLQARASELASTFGISLLPFFKQFLDIAEKGIVPLKKFADELSQLQVITERLQEDTAGNMLARVQSRIQEIQELLSTIDQTGPAAKLDQLIFGDDPTAALKQELESLLIVKDAIINTVKEARSVSGEISDTPAEKPSKLPPPPPPANTKQIDSMIERFRDEARTESERLQVLINELNKAVAGGLSQGIADKVLTQRLEALAEKMEQAELAGLNLEQQTRDMTAAEKEALATDIRRAEILDSLKNPLKEFKQFQKDVFSQVDIFDPDKLIPIEALDEVSKRAEELGLNLKNQLTLSDPDMNEAFFDQLQTRLEFIQNFVMSEEELEIQSHERRLAELQTFKENFLISEDERRALQLDLEAQHIEKMTELRKKGLTDLEKFNAMSFGKQTSTVLGEMVNMTAGVARENKAMFEINKQAATAQAIVSGIASVMKTYEAYPFPLSIVMGGLQAAANLAQISAIQSQTFSGGNAAPSLAGATAAPPVQNVGGPGGTGSPDQNVFIRLHGDVFGQDHIRKLIKEINEASKNGARVQVV